MLGVGVSSPRPSLPPGIVGRDGDDHPLFHRGSLECGAWGVAPLPQLGGAFEDEPPSLLGEIHPHEGLLELDVLHRCHDLKVPRGGGRVKWNL
jgi:hypothetical protein